MPCDDDNDEYTNLCPFSLLRAAFYSYIHIPHFLLLVPVFYHVVLNIHIY
jgi:hypothetical protein